MNRLIVLLLALLVALPQAHAQKRRKRVAVVLSGGGAKGMAHIGVLKVIEKAGIPVDIVTGTSMGSIVGGLYSIGYTPQQLDSLVRAQNWQFLLSDNERLYNQSLDMREKANTYIISRGITFGKRKGVSASGLVRGKNIATLFSSLTHEYNDSIDFNSLPRKYACVATDVITNTEHDFHSGVLADAMRCSMSIPGVFTPVRKGDKLLVDGGLQNNYPADLAKNLGADYIIGSTVQTPLRTADELNSAMSVIGQIVDLNCMNKYEENMSLTDIAVCVDPKPYGAASFTSAAIDSLIRRGEEEAMKHWDELLALKRKLGLPYDYRPKPVARQQPESMTEKRWFCKFTFNNLTERDERFIRRKFRLDGGDSLSITDIEEIATSMRMDLFCDAISYTVHEDSLGGQLTFDVSGRKSAQVHIGARFDTEEMAALQANAELPVRAWIPANVDLTLRLGKRIEAHGEMVLHPAGLNKLRIAYEFNRNDINVYSGGDRMYNATYNFHSIELTPLDFNVRNFNFRVSGKWETYHFSDLLAGESAVVSGKLNPIGNGHYFSYHARADYNSENDWYFPTRGSRMSGGFGYYTADLFRYSSDNTFTVVDAFWRTSFALDDRLTLQPMVFGRCLFGDNVPHMLGNVVGGSAFGHYVAQQMPFAGVGYVEFTDNRFVAFQLRLQENIMKNIHGVVRLSVAQHSNEFDTFFDSGHTMWGVEVGAYAKSMVGPLGANVGWSNKTKQPYLYITLGYEF